MNALRHPHEMSHDAALDLARAAAAVVCAPLALARLFPRPGLTVEAFHGLDFEGSSRLLKQVLARPDAEQLGDSLQAEVLGFVGAAELLLGRRAEAATTFAAALERSPRFRIDTMIFPPATGQER